MRLTRHSRRASGERERGAVLIEFAFAFVFLFSLAMGMVEYGLAYRAQQNVLAGTRTGARTGASLGKDQQADYLALSSLKADLSSSGLLDQVQLVVIYKASADDGQPPAACVTGSSTAQACNIFTGAQLKNMVSGDFGATGCSSKSVSNGWCPTTRNNVQKTADYLGIYVKIRHPFITEAYGTGLTITQRSVMRLEPAGGS